MYSYSFPLMGTDKEWPSQGVYILRQAVAKRAGPGFDIKNTLYIPNDVNTIPESSGHNIGMKLSQTNPAGYEIEYDYMYQPDSEHWKSRLYLGPSKLINKYLYHDVKNPKSQLERQLQAMMSRIPRRNLNPDDQVCLKGF